MRVYFEAVMPYQTIDIINAVENFLTGSAPGNNPAFAPPAPAIGAECRRVMNLRLESESRIKRPALFFESKVSPEARERGRYRADQAIAYLQELADAERAPRIVLANAIMKRAAETLGPDPDPEATARRLGLKDFEQQEEQQ